MLYLFGGNKFILRYYHVLLLVKSVGRTEDYCEYKSYNGNTFFLSFECLLFCTDAFHSALYFRMHSAVARSCHARTKFTESAPLQ